MHAKIRAFCLQKAGNSHSDYEDAFWFQEPDDLTSCKVRLAVGDGATEASFSALWAKLLVQSYGAGHLTPGLLMEILPSLQQNWLATVSEKPLPWYAEEKLNAGAFSSLVGLTIEAATPDNGSSGGWEAFAIGDSCLFQVRGEELVGRFPLARSELFDSRPMLISSIPSRNDCLEQAVRMMEGSWVYGDVFYLMTDALACWFLRRWELGSDPITLLNEVQTQDDFQRLADEQRLEMDDDGSRRLKNDDMTLVRCILDHR